MALRDILAIRVAEQIGGLACAALLTVCGGQGSAANIGGPAASPSESEEIIAV
jgi:hypothetical protein